MYIPYYNRKILEADGNLGLYSDSSQRLYTRIEDEEIFLKWPKGYPGEFVVKNWWGKSTWDFISVEKEENYINFASIILIVFGIKIYILCNLQLNNRDYQN